MVSTLRVHIIITFILACATVALIVTSFATPSWIDGTIESTSTLRWQNKVNYGLFSGQINGMRSMQLKGELLTMSCEMSANVCVMSCQKEEEKRKEELESLVHNASRPGCPFSLSETGRCNGECTEFINAGIWVSCVLFLSLALLWAVLAAVFAVVNSAISPIEPILGVPGLYIWNGAGALCALVVLALWGALYSNTLVHNIAYTETVTYNYKSQASLGVSYWLLIVALFLMLANIGILVLRKYQLAHEPPPQTIKMEENTDGIIFLY